MAAQEVAEARDMLDEPMWREKPATGAETMTLHITLDGKRYGEVTIAAGYVQERREYGWTRIRELTIEPINDDGTRDGDGNVEPVLDRAVRQARRTLTNWEATRRFVNDVVDGIGPELLTTVRAPDDKLRPSEARETAALVFNMAKDAGRRNPVVWVAAVLGVSERTASRYLEGAEERGLVTRPQKQTREKTKKAQTKRGKK